VVHQGRRHGPTITNKSHPAVLISTSQPGGPPCWNSPLAFGLIVYNYTYPICGILGFSNTNTVLNLSDGQFRTRRRHGSTRVMTPPTRRDVSDNSRLYNLLYSTPSSGNQKLPTEHPCKDSTIGTGYPFSQLPSRYKLQAPSPLSSS
jgi:hypothetical protein